MIAHAQAFVKDVRKPAYKAAKKSVQALVRQPAQKNAKAHVYGAVYGDVNNMLGGVSNMLDKLTSKH